MAKTIVLTGHKGTEEFIDKIQRKLAENLGIDRVVKCTTAPLTAGEITNEDYVYVSDDIFNHLRCTGALMEYYADARGQYGTLSIEVVSKHRTKRKSLHVFVEYLHFVEKMRDDLIVIYIYLPIWFIQKNLIKQGYNETQRNAMVMQDEFIIEEVKKKGLVDGTYVIDTTHEATTAKALEEQISVISFSLEAIADKIEFGVRRKVGIDIHDN